MDKLIKISDDELNEILANHKLWIDSKSKYGNHANLCDADLSGANLSDVALSGADLRGANLDYSCLQLWCGSLSANFD